MATWAVRVSEELKEKLDKMKQDSGMEGEQFAQQLITVMCTEEIKKQKPQLSEDLDELQILTQRIYAIFLNFCERSENILNDKEEKYSAELIEKYARIKELEESLSEVNQSNKELGESYNSAVREKEKCEAEYSQLLDSLSTKQELIDEYKRKNDTLTGIVDEYKGYKDSNSALTDELQNMKAELADMQTLVKAKDTEIQNLSQRSRDELQMASDKAEMMQEKALLETAKKHQEELSSITETYNQKISSLQDMISSDSEKYKALLEQLESVRNAKRKINDAQSAQKGHKEPSSNE